MGQKAEYAALLKNGTRFITKADRLVFNLLKVGEDTGEDREKIM